MKEVETLVPGRIGSVLLKNKFCVWTFPFTGASHFL